MIITKEFLDSVGRRSAIARSAMVQAGDKSRIKALKEALISIGACEITRGDAEMLNLTIKHKKYSFLSSPLNFVLLDDRDFSRFEPLKDGVSLEIAHFNNGLIGILRRKNSD
ncbi:MAG: hypothetical protein FWH52_04100 [Synergistaceae bacterium]|nr:hypothetical protein [Synergistaceae bacterium]